VGTSNTVRSEGFTLLETLIAFLILSISIGIAVHSLSQASWNTGRSEIQKELRYGARTLLAELEPTIDSATTRSGEWEEKYDWNLVVEPMSGSEALYTLSLTVSLVHMPQITTTYIGFVQLDD